MSSRVRTLRWCAAAQIAVLYGTLGLVLITVLGFKGDVALIWSVQTVLWTLFTLVGRSRGGLIGVPADQQPDPESGPDLPRRSLTRRALRIGLALYGAVGALSLVEAVVNAPRHHVLTVALIVDTLVIAAYIVFASRIARSRRHRDIVV